MKKGLSTALLLGLGAAAAHASALTAAWDAQMTRSGGMAVGIVSPVLPPRIEAKPGLSLGPTKLTADPAPPASSSLRLQTSEPAASRSLESTSSAGVIILPTLATIDNLSVVFLRYTVADAPASGDLVRLDNLRLSAFPIPEPSTAVTLICGLAMLFGLRRMMASRR